MKKAVKKKVKSVKKSARTSTKKKVVRCGIPGCGKKGVNSRTHGEH